jgi:hypothetical protein
MGRGYLGKWQEYKDSFFSLKLTQPIGWLQRAWGRNDGFKEVVSGGIYRPKKLRAVPIPLKSNM